MYKTSDSSSGANFRHRYYVKKAFIAYTQMEAFCIYFFIQKLAVWWNQTHILK